MALNPFDNLISPIGQGVYRDQQGLTPPPRLLALAANAPVPPAPPAPPAAPAAQPPLLGTGNIGGVSALSPGMPSFSAAAPIVSSALGNTPTPNPPPPGPAPAAASAPGSAPAQVPEKGVPLPPSRSAMGVPYGNVPLPPSHQLAVAARAGTPAPPAGATQGIEHVAGPNWLRNFFLAGQPPPTGMTAMINQARMGAGFGAGEGGNR